MSAADKFDTDPKQHLSQVSLCPVKVFILMGQTNMPGIGKICNSEVYMDVGEAMGKAMADLSQ
jgi:hypothetical protein